MVVSETASHRVAALADVGLPPRCIANSRLWPTITTRVRGMKESKPALAAGHCRHRWLRDEWNCSSNSSSESCEWTTLAA